MRLKRRAFLHLAGAWALAGCDDAAPGPSTGPACQDDWWVCGNFGPVEESEALDLEVVGELPASLDGLFVRNGPNPLGTPSGHWFLGDGMLHGVRLEGGAASWYRSRHIHTDSFGKPKEDGLAPPGLTDHQANTSIVAHGGHLLSLEEIGLPFAVSPDDLSTVGAHDFAGQLAGPMTAHPKIDPVTGEMLFFGYDVLGDYLTYHAVDAQGVLTRSEPITVPGPAMMHDFQVTATHVVFMFLPVMFDIQLVLDGASFPFRWDPSVGAKIGVMPRTGGGDDVEWFDIEPCYVFHTFNAFNDPTDPNKILLDAIRYPQMWVETADEFDAVGEMWRWEMTLGTGVKEGAWASRFVEFPRIDPRVQGLPYRYGYGAASIAPAPNPIGANPPDTIVKFDREGGTEKLFTLPDGLRGGEAIFVPASASGAEDDGHLITFAYDAARDASELIVLKADDFDAGLVARVKLPGRVPYGFHGTWLPST